MQAPTIGSVMLSMLDGFPYDAFTLLISQQLIYQCLI